MVLLVPHALLYKQIPRSLWVSAETCSARRLFSPYVDMAIAEPQYTYVSVTWYRGAGYLLIRRLGYILAQKVRRMRHETTYSAHIFALRVGGGMVVLAGTQI